MVTVPTGAAAVPVTAVINVVGAAAVDVPRGD